MPVSNRLPPVDVRDSLYLQQLSLAGGVDERWTHIRTWRHNLSLEQPRLFSLPHSFIWLYTPHQNMPLQLCSWEAIWQIALPFYIPCCILTLASFVPQGRKATSLRFRFQGRHGTTMSTTTQSAPSTSSRTRGSSNVSQQHEKRQENS